MNYLDTQKYKNIMVYLPFILINMYTNMDGASSVYVFPT